MQREVPLDWSEYLLANREQRTWGCHAVRYYDQYKYLVE